MDQDLLRKIRQQLKEGFSEEIIRTELRNSDYSYEDIDACFQNIQKRKRIKALIAAFIILLLFLAWSLYLYQYKASNNFNKFVEQGISLCNGGKYEESIEKFDKAILLNNLFPKAHYHRGRCFIQLGRYDEALIDLKKVVFMSRYIPPEKETPRLFYLLGIAYCGRGDYKSGIDQLNIAISLNSSNQKFYESLGDCYKKMGNLEKAEEAQDISNQLSN